MSNKISAALEEKTDLQLIPEMSEIISPLVIFEEKSIAEKVKDMKASVKENIATDYEFARSNMRQLLEDGMSAVAGAIQLAKDSESPRVYESTGLFIKTLADINKDLLALSEVVSRTQREVAPAEKDPVVGQTATTITNNNVIHVGSSEELSNIIAERMVKLSPTQPNRIIEHSNTQG